VIIKFYLNKENIIDASSIRSVCGIDNDGDIEVSFKQIG